MIASIIILRWMEQLEVMNVLPSYVFCLFLNSLERFSPPHAVLSCPQFVGFVSQESERVQELGFCLHQAR